MAGGSGRGLMTAGLIVAFVGLCIVLIRVLRVPEERGMPEMIPEDGGL